MLFDVIGVLSVILGLCVAIYLVFERFSSKVTLFSIFITLVTALIVSGITAVVMIAAVWPPVTLGSWILFAVFASAVLLVFLTGNKKKRGGWSQF